MPVIAGLDVGGAHLKVALIDDGKTIAAEQFVCPLWKGFEFLDHALDAASPTIQNASAVAITMTGELSDIFDNRDDGVHRLIDHLNYVFGSRAHFWCGELSFQSAEAAKEYPADVASTNFLATSKFVAKTVGDGLLIDMGSTTTDIIPLRGGKPTPAGLTDAERLETGELVYTGFTRTACMGLADRVPFRGQLTTLTHEYFATMADVYRILEDLPDGIDLHDTADGKGKSVEESIDRLARMIGRDASDGQIADWVHLADTLAEHQLRRIHDGALQVLSMHPKLKSSVLVSAGIGAARTQELAKRLNMDAKKFTDLAATDPNCSIAASHAAPAVAVAQLLSSAHA